MPAKRKTPKDSLTILTDTVLPGETNAINNLFGGELLARMDRAAAISAKRHSKQFVVTSSVNNVSFGMPIPLGSTVTIEAKVSRAFNSSMEVYIDVWIDNENGEKIKANEAKRHINTNRIKANKGKIQENSGILKKMKKNKEIKVK